MLEISDFEITALIFKERMILLWPLKNLLN